MIELRILRKKITEKEPIHTEFGVHYLLHDKIQDVLQYRVPVDTSGCDMYVLDPPMTKWTDVPIVEESK